MEVDQFVRSNLDEFEAKLAKNDLALDVIVGTGSSLSILGSASIIITTLIFHKLQKHCFSLRLILYVQTSTPTFTHALMVNRFISLCDLIISASFISGIVSKQSGWWSQQSKKDSVCVIQVRVIFRAVFAFHTPKQAAILQYFAVGSFLWMACFAHSLWRSVKRTAYNQLKERKRMRKFEIIYHSICWSLPIIPVTILGPLNLLGPTGTW